MTVRPAQLTNAALSMRHGSPLYEDPDHRYIWLGMEEDDDEGGAIQVNQYLIVHDGKGWLVDPGGVHVFSHVIANVSRWIDLKDLEHLFYSHQDPDVCSGMMMWQSVTPSQIHISALWSRFIPHFGKVARDRVMPIPDSGARAPLGGGDFLEFVPAHFLHSPGNFSVFDSRSRILFSGDIGAAVFPPNQRYVFVEDFEKHRPLAEGFHRRYLAGNKVVREWTKRVRALRPEVIAPQHGALFRGPEVEQFLSWLDGLECGADIIGKIYGG